VKDRRRKARPEQKEGDTTFHPSHYNMGRFEVIDVIDDWKLDFCLGNAIKYIARAPYKGKEKEDLRKAIEYLELKIERLGILPVLRISFCLLLALHI